MGSICSPNRSNVLTLKKESKSSFNESDDDCTPAEESKSPPRSLSPDRFPRKSILKVNDKEDVLVEEAITARVSQKIKTVQDIQLITTCLSQHFIFANLVDDASENIIDHMRHLTMGPNETIFDQDQPGKNFFIVATGKVAIIINGKTVNTFRKGSCFGELALLHNSLRTATVKTVDRTTLWSLDRDTFKKAVERINAFNYNENMLFLNSIPLFDTLTPYQKECLVGALTTHKFKRGQRIVNENDPGELFYIIKEGQVSCTQGTSEIRRMGRGDFFGEQALLYNSSRTATITAIDNTVKCLSINRNMLHSVLGDNLDRIIYKNSIRMAYDGSKTLSKLTKQQQEKLLVRMKVLKYDPDQVVIAKGTLKCTELIIVLKGTLVELTTQQEVKSSIGCLGDDSIIENADSSIYEDDVVAEVTTNIARITKEAFEEAIGGTYENVSENNEIMSVLQRVQLLRGLSHERLLALSKALEVQRFEPKDIIVKQHTEGHCLYIMREGSVEVWRDHIKIRAVKKFDYFGERSVLFNDFRSASIIATSTVVVWLISKQTFLELINESIRHQLLNRIQLQDENVTMAELVSVRSVGKGSFGIVQLVCHREKRNVYALKSVNRQIIELYDIHENLRYERSILLELDHVLIMKLVKTFKDSERVYLLMEYVRGHVLYDVIREIGILSEDEARFYTACLMLTLHYLHDRNIIYRDLKPENVMVDEEGYTKLIDFGIAKIVSGRTYTIVGTPHYMAPEVITRNGYNFAADYWSLGVMLYEFLCGKVPFGEQESDPYAIYKSTLETELKFPEFVDKNSPVIILIEQLLSRSPAVRVGGSPEQLMKHHWFQGIDWDQLVSRQVRPPYIPPTKNLINEIQEAIRRNRSPVDFFTVI
mmetsp:Transcript_691/g.1250  ORF Transcript_691/g.1250 Transcript_691/m.1250 type:complete len:878 (-) Transcript_691:74-2707(-)